MADQVERLQHALPEYHDIERGLGRGSVATISLSVGRSHHRKVALKVLSPEPANLAGLESLTVLARRGLQ